MRNVKLGGVVLAACVLVGCAQSTPISIAPGDTRYLVTEAYGLIDGTRVGAIVKIERAARRACKGDFEKLNETDRDLPGNTALIWEIRCSQ